MGRCNFVTTAKIRRAYRIQTAASASSKVRGIAVCSITTAEPGNQHSLPSLNLKISQIITKLVSFLLYKCLINGCFYIRSSIRLTIGHQLLYRQSCWFCSDSMIWSPKLAKFRSTWAGMPLLVVGWTTAFAPHRFTYSLLNWLISLCIGQPVNGKNHCRNARRASSFTLHLD